MKKTGRVKAVVFAIVLSASCAFAGAGNGVPSVADAKPVKNVIMLIPDGTSVAAYTLARWYKGSALSLDPYACGLVRTYSSDSPIADSAPASTAFSTGFKSHAGFVGVMPDKADMPGLKPVPKGEERRPLANVAEAAKLSGRGVGIVATCEIMHATPADFSAHSASRSGYDDIFEQQVHSGFDVFLGGGAKKLPPAERADKEDMAAAIKEQGFELVTSPDAMRASQSDRLFGLFAPMALSYELDRDPARQPSLAEMTRKAIETLSRNPKGFFLMVEGSKVDWAAHGNNPVGIVSEVISFDEAAKVAIEFALKDGDTAIIVCADHGTGGITFGERALKSYSTSTLDDFLKYLRKAKRTEEGMAAELSPDMDKAKIKEALDSRFGVGDPTDEELDKIAKSLADSGKGLAGILGAMMSSRSRIGWTTGGHTGEEVALFSLSPNARPMGVMENSDMAAWLSAWLGVSLEATTQRLFPEIRPLLEEKGAAVSEDLSDKANPALVAVKGGDTLRLPVNRNYALLNGERKPLPGVTVHSNSKWYASREAAGLLK